MKLICIGKNFVQLAISLSGLVTVIMPVGWVIDEWRAEKTVSKWPVIPSWFCGNTKTFRGIHAYQIGHNLKSEQLLLTLLRILVILLENRKFRPV